MTPNQFWLILGAFLTLIVGWFAAARIYLAAQKWRHARAVSADEPEPDLDARWAEFWHERDIQYRASDLWQWLHEDEAALLDEKHDQLTTALDKVDAKVSTRAARVVDRGVRRFGFAGIVDCYAQWLYERRRSVPRMVAVLNKTKTWPDEWQQQLRVLLDEGAVARAQGEVRARRARGEVWAR